LRQFHEEQTSEGVEEAKQGRKGKQSHENVFPFVGTTIQAK
jgi:hypothetical protein